MCTLWMISVVYVLASMLPNCRPSEYGTCGGKKCNVTKDEVCLDNECASLADQCDLDECKKKGGSECVQTVCYTKYDECGGKKCNLTAREICLNNECVPRGDNCWVTKNTMLVTCRRRGVLCGGYGQYCNINSKCINDTCHYISRTCVGGGDGTKCGNKYAGICSDGVCLQPCGTNWCPCRKAGDKYCTTTKCKESFCL